jgi:hypothetical protein
VAAPRWLLLRPFSGLWSGGLRRPKGPVPVPPLASSGAAPGPDPRAVPSAERHPDALHPYGPLRPLPSCGAPTVATRCCLPRHPAWSSAAPGPRGRWAACPSGLAFAHALFYLEATRPAHFNDALWPRGTAGPTSLALTTLCPGCSPPQKIQKMVVCLRPYTLLHRIRWLRPLLYITGGLLFCPIVGFCPPRCWSLLPCRFPFINKW